MWNSFQIWGNAAVFLFSFLLDSSQAFSLTPSDLILRNSYSNSMTADSLTKLCAKSDEEEHSVEMSVDAKKKSDGDVGGYDPSEGIQPEREVNVGDPQIKVKEKERSVTSILRELAAIQQKGPQKYCILGTRHCSYLHQQIIELL